MPGAQGAIAPGLHPMRNSASRWRCLQLGCAKPKLRERRNPLGKTRWNTSHKKCAPLRGVFGVRAQIPRAFGPPFGCFAAQRNCDLT